MSEMTFTYHEWDDADGFGLDQVTDDLVVEVVDVLPLDAFPQVLLLLRLQGQLDEELLELLVTEVDAELLKAGQDTLLELGCRQHKDPHHHTSINNLLV